MRATVTPIRTTEKTDEVHELFVQDKRELQALLAFLVMLRDDVHFQDRLTSFVADHEVEGLERAMRALEVLTSEALASDPHGYIAKLVKLYQALANVVYNALELDGIEIQSHAHGGATFPSRRLMRLIRAQYDSDIAAAVAGTTDAGHAALAASYKKD